MIVVDSKDNLQDPNVRTEAISGTNLFGFKETLNSSGLHEALSEELTTIKERQPDKSNYSVKRRFGGGGANFQGSANVNQTGSSSTNAP